jgi:glycosyltransferase involved in cell wall biosynthesis
VGEVVNSVEQMAQTISKIKSNPTIWRALGQASRQYFSQHFSASQAVDSYEQCFRQALA